MTISTSADTATMLSSKPAFDAAVLYRRACKKFQRFDGTDRSNGASQSDPAVLQQATQALELARLSPSAYNAQPYKFVLVHSKEQKEALAKYALGPNRNRVLDSDATVVFLADRQILRTLPTFRKQLSAMTNKWSRRKLQLYLAIFSSGYPLPRFFVRTSVALVHLFTRTFYPMPTLSSAETWASKQTLMVAMTFMLACASRGLDTIPMEGIHAGGIRRALNVPSRYAVPLIVSVGRRYQTDDTTSDSSSTKGTRPRYPMEEMIFGNTFGEPLLETLALPSNL
ncbi:hypothetical protein MPSEU_000953300 [Mayamaea pseudoterrestris]|nr:hypothetical protein MPSEU_000953300 [Mayamaea pseudoterrestris]